MEPVKPDKLSGRRFFFISSVIERNGFGARVTPSSSMIRIAIFKLSCVMEKMELETALEYSRRLRGASLTRKSCVALLVEAIFAKRIISSAEVWMF